MAARQTSDLLKSYAALLRSLGDEPAAGGVDALCRALDVVDDKKLKAAVTKVGKAWANQPAVGKSAPSLDVRLKALEKLLSVAGAKVSSDIGLLTNLVQGHAEVDAIAFETELRAAFIVALSPPPPRAKSPRPPAREPFTEFEVREWADRLTAVSTDHHAFEQELAALQAVPKLKPAELQAVAERYLGHGAKGGKAKVLGAMRSRQKQDAIEASREGRISRIAV